jgi:hypothetical protein
MAKRKIGVDGIVINVNYPEINLDLRISAVFYVRIYKVIVEVDIVNHALIVKKKFKDKSVLNKGRKDV